MRGTQNGISCTILELKYLQMKKERQIHYNSCLNCYPQSPQLQVLYTMEEEGVGPSSVQSGCPELPWLGHILFYPRSSNPFSCIFLETSGWLSGILDSQWGFPDTWKFQVCMLLSAAGKAGFSPLLFSFIVLLGNHICLQAVPRWTWPCFQAVPWPKQCKEWNIKYACPWMI